MSYKLTVTHSNGKPFVWQAQDGETYLSVTDETGRDLDIRLEGLPVLDDDRGGLVCLNSAARFDKWNRTAVR